MDQGIIQAGKQLPLTPVPQSWLGKPTAPLTRPDWAVISQLSKTQTQNLLAQIAYDASQWDYTKVGANNELGRYQHSPQILENYGLIQTGAYDAYGSQSVTYQHCWRQRADTYADYLAEVFNLQDFLNNKAAQELLAYQRLVDLYKSAIRINTIQIQDTAEIVAGMLYVCWALGAGSVPTSSNTSGTGAYAWRYYNVGSGSTYYVAGRYSVAVLSR